MALRIDPVLFRNWARLCLDSLAAARDEIDALNVFPVPDSDTGTNAYFTFAAGVEALDQLDPNADAMETMRVFAEGLLIGARGNCGTILAELLRGSMRSLRHNPEEVTSQEVAAALESASTAAYAAVGKPQEGTILTVGAAAAAAARAAAATEDDPKRVFDAAASAAREALALTPTQLERLARAGVVDAGGRALVVVLDSLALALTGRQPTPVAALVPVPLPDLGADLDQDGPSYEVMYLLRTDDSQIATLRQSLEPLGDSLVVVGGDGLWNVHVHVDDVGKAIEAGLSIGRPFNLKITHFAEQISRQKAPTGRLILSAVTGEGLAEITEQAGAKALTFGPGQSLSVSQIAAVIDAASAAEIICLPNRAGHIAMFEAAAERARNNGVRVAVLPTTVQVQALAALAVHDPGRPFDVVVVAMSNAAGATRHGAVTVASEAGITMAGAVRAGDVLGVVNGDFAVIGNSQAEVAEEVLNRLDLATAELVTIVVGREGDLADCDQVRAQIARSAPHVDVEVLQGGQETYNLFIAVE